MWFLPNGWVMLARLKERPRLLLPVLTVATASSAAATLVVVEVFLVDDAALAEADLLETCLVETVVFLVDKVCFCREDCVLLVDVFLVDVVEGNAAATTMSKLGSAVELPSLCISSDVFDACPTLSCLWCPCRATWLCGMSGIDLATIRPC